MREWPRSSFFLSFATIPAASQLSFNKANGARSIVVVLSLHFYLALLALLGALISARDAVSSKASNDWLLVIGFWLLVCGY